MSTNKSNKNKGYTKGNKFKGGKTSTKSTGNSKFKSHSANRKKVEESKMNIKEQCLHLDDKARGVVKHNDEFIPVDYLLKDELALIEINKKGKFYDTRVLSVIEKSKKRVSPKCKHFYDCGGCQLQHMTYQGQLNYKANTVRKLMLPFGTPDEIIGMDDPYHYRNKITSTFANKSKNVISGFYQQYSHIVTEIDECIIQDEVADSILETVRYMVKKYKIRIYNEDTENGFIRHVLIRTGFKSKEVMVVFVVTDKIFPSKNNFVKELTAAHPEISTIVLNVNDKPTSVVLGKTEQVIYGSGTITDELCGHNFDISPQSFYQVNTVQTEKLYTKALKLANISKEDIVLDTYSGIGTISILAAQYADMVYGVEINKSSVTNAIRNARKNKVKNIKFVEADATHAMMEMAKEDFKIDVLIMDPPREGSTPEFIHATLQLMPKKVVYISCNPETQARDLKLFTRKYNVKNISPVDMFPQTTHVECIVLLEKK